VAVLPVVGIMMWHRELSLSELATSDYISMLYKVPFSLSLSALDLGRA
jgi:hypothetical protein